MYIFILQGWLQGKQGNSKQGQYKDLILLRHIRSKQGGIVLICCSYALESWRAFFFFFLVLYFFPIIWIFQKRKRLAMYPICRFSGDWQRPPSGLMCMVVKCDWQIIKNRILSVPCMLHDSSPSLFSWKDKKNDKCYTAIAFTILQREHEKKTARHNWSKITHFCTLFAIRKWKMARHTIYGKVYLGVQNGRKVWVQVCDFVCLRLYKGSFFQHFFLSLLCLPFISTFTLPSLIAIHDDHLWFSDFPADSKAGWEWGREGFSW